MTADASGYAAPRARFHSLVFVGIAAAFVALTLAGLTTFPAYYEDESWTYLAAFEALRGNGFTWAAFGEGKPIFGVFLGIVTPLVGIPTGPEQAVRLVAAAWGMVALTGAYVLARRVARSSAWIAPALMMTTPFVFMALRYGRNDVVALALAMWSITAAAYHRPLPAGVLAGLSVSIHPMFLWIAVPGVWFAAASGPAGVQRYVIGGCLGGSPQLVWFLVNRSDVQTIMQRFGVSSSVGSLASHGVVSSIAAEPQRYLNYATAVPTWLLGTHIVSYFVLPLMALRSGYSKLAATVVTLSIPAAVGLAVLTQGKNPYYLYSVLPFVAVAAACGVDSLPRTLRIAVAAAVAVACAAATTSTAVATWKHRHDVTANEMTAALARELPHGAVVVSANMYAGIVRRRPDLRFFNYHALSYRPGWQLPACAELPARIRALVDNDLRPSSRGPAPSEAYIVGVGDYMGTGAYLRLIYVKSTDADAKCLLASDAGAMLRIRACRDNQGPCNETVVARMQLRR